MRLYEFTDPDGTKHTLDLEQISMISRPSILAAKQAPCTIQMGSGPLSVMTSLDTGTKIERAWRDYYSPGRAPFEIVDNPKGLS